MWNIQPDHVYWYIYILWIYLQCNISSVCIHRYNIPHIISYILYIILYIDSILCIYVYMYSPLLGFIQTPVDENRRSLALKIWSFTARLERQCNRHPKWQFEHGKMLPHFETTTYIYICYTYIIDINIQYLYTLRSIIIYIYIHIISDTCILFIYYIYIYMYKYIYQMISVCI